MPEQTLLRITAITGPVDADVADLIRKGDRSVPFEPSIRTGGHLRLDRVIRNVPYRDLDFFFHASEFGGLRLRTLEVLLECLRVLGKKGYHYGSGSPLQVGRNHRFDTRKYTLDLKIKKIEVLSSSARRRS